MNIKAQVRNNQIIIKNGIWLYALQICNTVLPLITLPYVTRILGVEKYGIFSFSLNLVSYLQVIVEYGFNLSATRKIATDSSGRTVSFTFTKIFICRILLCFCSFVMLMFFMTFYSSSEIEKKCILVLCIMIVGGALDQTWVFQGLQKMEYISIVSITSRIISVVLIFLFVKDASDFFIYCFLYTTVPLLIGIVEILIITFKLNYRLVKINLSDIVTELKDGWYIFTSSFSSKIFSGIGITILGFISTPYNVGVYAAIQKISYIILLSFTPIGQIIYPYISKEFKISYKNGENKLRKISKYIMLIFACLIVFIMLFSKTIVFFIYGNEYVNYHFLVKPLMIYDFFSILNNFLGIQLLVGSGHMKEYSKAFQIGIILSILLNLMGGFIGKLYGIALAPAIAEICLTVLLLVEISKVRKENVT